MLQRHVSYWPGINGQGPNVCSFFTFSILKHKPSYNDFNHKEINTKTSITKNNYIYVNHKSFGLYFDIRKRGFMYMYLKYFTSEMILVTHSFYAFIKLSNEQFNDLNKFLRIHGQIQ